MALSVQRPVKERLDHILAVNNVHRVFAADGRPVGAAAHVHIGGQIDGLIRKIVRRIAKVDRTA